MIQPPPSHKKSTPINAFPKGSGKGVQQSSETKISSNTLGLVDDFISMSGGFKNNMAIEGGKVILVGDSNVGKTCMFMRVSRNLFTNNYKPTIGLDFNFEYYEVFGTPFTISLWDTAGQERFKSLTKAYYRGAHAAIIAFSLNEPETLSNVTNWIAEVRQFAEEPTLKIFLVGTKCDLLNVVDRKDAESIAIENEAEYWEVSAKTDVNVKPLFDRVAYLVWETQLTRWKVNSEKKAVTEEEFQAPASLTSGKPPTKSSCCKL